MVTTLKTATKCISAHGVCMALDALSASLPDIAVLEGAHNVSVLLHGVYSVALDVLETT